MPWLPFPYRRARSRRRFRFFGRGICRCEAGAQRFLVDLPVGGLGQFRKHGELPRFFVARQVTRAVRPDRLHFDRAARLRYDERMHRLAPDPIGHADDGTFGYRWMPVQDILDLSRIDVVATGDDHFLFAIDDSVETLLVDARQVTGGAPAFAHGLLRCNRIVPITRHDMVAANDDLAHLAGRNAAAGVVHQPDPYTDGDTSGRANAGAKAGNWIGEVFMLRKNQVRMRRFGQSVDLHEYRAEGRERPLQHRLGHGCTAVDDGAKA